MTTAKKTAARKPARAPGAIQLKSRPKNAERVPLFYIDDVEYTMPAVVELGDALQIAALLRLQPDENLKGMQLVRELCGVDAWAALLSDSTMSRGEWRAIVDTLQKHALGQLEDEEGEEGKG